MEWDEQSTQIHYDDLLKTSQLTTGICLVVLHRDRVRIVTLEPEQPVTIGRGSAATVRLADQGLSRRHARFFRKGDDVWVEDLGSTNGTRVNGQSIERQLLTRTDRVMLGAVTITLHAEAAPHSSQLGVLPHDSFMRRLGDAVDSAAKERRTVAVVMARALRGDGEHLFQWGADCADSLAATCVLGEFSSNTLELLLVTDSEPMAQECVSRARDLRCGGGAPPRLGVSLFPTAARTADALHQTAREALQATSEETPLHWASKQDSRSWSTRGTDADVATESDVVVASPAMCELRTMARKAAKANISVLLWGETGVGKEVFAQIIHDGSKRRTRDLVCVNCGAIPETLIESKLFGYEKGAFTGAERRTPGVFEEAEGGTVLLDEVGELSLQAQVALLRVLESRTVTRVGGHKAIPIDVRLLAATNRDLEQMSTTGEFRPDLLFRLNAVTLRIPPLRQRPEEIASLCERFVREANRNNDCSVSDMGAEVLSLLRLYDWPGNIRELRNVVERAVVLAGDGTIGVEHLPQSILDAARNQPTEPTPEGPRQDGAQLPDSIEITTVGPPPEPDETFKERVARKELALMADALHRSGGNKAAASRQLGLSLRTLKEKVRQAGPLLEMMDASRATAELAELDQLVPTGLGYWERIRRYEMTLIRDELEIQGGNKSQTARALNMPLETLKYKIRKYEI